MDYLPPPTPDPFAGENSKALMSILNTLGSAEAARRRKIMTENILRAMGGGESIISAALMEPGFSGGFQGALQKFASPFAAPAPGMEDIIAGKGIESAFETFSPSQILNQWRLNMLMDMTEEEQKQYMLKPPITIQTGQKLLEPGQRQEIADTEFREKVGLSPAEKNLGRKSAEEILKGTRKRFWHWGTEDYTQEMMVDNYKSWRAENSYEEQTPRKQKELDEIWDAKMALWKKSGVKFDKDNIIGKNEIEWNPNDPQVKKLREGTSETTILKPGLEKPKTSVEKGMVQQQTEPTDKSEELTLIEVAPIIEKAQRNGIDRMVLYQEMGKLMDLDLTKEELMTAYDRLAEGATALEIIMFLKNKKVNIIRKINPDESP